jgi:hypothetical protein
VLRRARISLLAALLLAGSALACAGAQAYVDWRPGLSAADFDGTFEIDLDEYERFADTGEPNTLFDRHHGVSSSEAAAAMKAVGERLAGAPGDPRGYSILALEGAPDGGSVRFRDDGGRELSGTVDWFAATPDRRWAALLSDTKLAVAIDGASTGVDLGSLLGGAVRGYRFMMLVEGEELTVFALPEMGGAVTAYEAGYVLSFRHREGARRPWEISVARVSITM